MQWVLLVLVVAGFFVIELKLYRDRKRLAPIRAAVKQEAVVYSSPISAQWGRGWWGRANARGMRLVVRERSLELSFPLPGGSLLATEWYCRGKDARMKMGRGNFLPPWVKRDCIVLSMPAIGDASAEQEIRIASVPPWRHDLRAAWDALAACGVQASGTPPEDQS